MKKRRPGMGEGGEGEGRGVRYYAWTRKVFTPQRER